MRNGSKLFGARDIALLRGQFEAARWRLTCIYVIILGLLLLISSSVTYSAFSHRLEHRFARLPARPDLLIVQLVEVPQPAQVRADLVNTFLVVNGLLLLSGSFLSYWLAGLTLRPIQKSYDEQRHFLSNASHELRTPLAILQTTLENEKGDGQHQPATVKRLDSSLEEVQLMGRLVSDLLILSRLDEGVPTAEVAVDLNLAELITTTVERFKPLAEQRRVTLQVANLPSLRLNAPPELVSRALGNLLRNAILYNKVEGKVSVNLTQEGKLAVVEVSDTGLGMTPEDSERVFDRFFRVDKSRSRVTGGSGLGLAIVKSIVDYLGGSISINSQLDKGTTVHLSLPIHRTS